MGIPAPHLLSWQSWSQWLQLSHPTGLLCVCMYVCLFLCTCVFACSDMFVYVCMFVCVCNQPRMLYSSAVSLTFGLHCTGTHQGDYAPLLASAGTSLSTHRNGKCTSPFPTHLHGSDDDIRLLILAYVTSYWPSLLISSESWILLSTIQLNTAAIDVHVQESLC